MENGNNRIVQYFMQDTIVLSRILNVGENNCWSIRIEVADGSVLLWGAEG